MGCCGSFSAIGDNFKSIEEVQQHLIREGLESSNLILGIDYTGSNQVTGAKSFNGKNLHECSNGVVNPYMEVISVVGRTLEKFDDDKIIPVFGFGDVNTADKSVFPFYPDKECVGFEQVLERYKEISPNIDMAGPTDFAPLIRKAIEIVRNAHYAYHILVIVTDGQVNSEAATIRAIVDATSYPLSIICVGVGDGPWDLMNEFDDRLPARRFDNFQFVEFYKLKKKYCENFDPAFALHAMMEIPDQYKAIKKLNLLSEGGGSNV